MDVSLVYMVAGLSSRFGGKIKQFAEVGRNGETFIECSIKQALPAGFSKIIFVVGNKTEQPFKNKFNGNYKGIPVFYVRQSYNPEKRDRPWGTADALCSAKNLIKEPCVICNGDDLYGEKSFKVLVDHLQNTDENATIGIKLENMLPDEGKVTRGIFNVNNGYLESAREVFEISKSNFYEKGLRPDSLCNMNLFGLQLPTIHKLSKRVESFKRQYKNERLKECFIHVELANLVRENQIKIKVYSSEYKWLGITNPEDEKIVKQELEKQNL